MREEGIMTEQGCLICSHPKRAAIEASIADGTIPRTLPGRFGVKKIDLAGHLVHTARQAFAPSDVVPHAIVPLVSPQEPHDAPSRRAFTPSDANGLPDSMGGPDPRELLTHGMKLIQRAFHEASETERPCLAARLETALMDLNDYFSAEE
jgi:hypothetical protein